MFCLATANRPPYAQHVNETKNITEIHGNMSHQWAKKKNIEKTLLFSKWKNERKKRKTYSRIYLSQSEVQNELVFDWWKFGGNIRDTHNSCDSKHFSSQKEDVADRKKGRGEGTRGIESGVERAMFQTIPTRKFSDGKYSWILFTCEYYRIHITYNAAEKHNTSKKKIDGSVGTHNVT